MARPHTRKAAQRARTALAAAALVLLSGCGTLAPRRDLVNIPYPAPRLTQRGTELGLASWYGPGFHRKRTANGETYDQHAMTAAHRTLPLGTWIEVTDRSTGKSVVVRVNDRGPYHPDRSLDLSYAAAQKLGSVQRGVAPVEIRVLQPKYASYPSVVYSVQLAAFSDRREAERLIERLQPKGAPAYLSTLRAEPPMYRVRVGPYNGRVRAHEVAQRLRREGFGALIVEINPQPDRTRAATSGTPKTSPPAATPRTREPRTS